MNVQNLHFLKPKKKLLVSILSKDVCVISYTFVLEKNLLLALSSFV